MLERGLLIELPGEKFRKLGGQGLEQIKARCLERMIGWMVAAVKTIRAEFPEFEGLLSFQALSLRPRHAEAVVQKHLAKLAHVFKEDLPTLKLEFKDCAHFAQKRRC